MRHNTSMAGRPRNSLLIFLLLTALLWPITAASASCSKEMRIAIFEVKPFYYRGPQGKLAGLDIELIDLIFKAANCPYKLKVVTWKRAIQGIKHGTLDIALNASITPDRRKFAHFTVPYRRETMVMYMRREDMADFRPNTLADVAASDLNIGVSLGGWYGNEYASLYANDSSFRQRILKTQDEVKLFQWLQAGRIDIAFNDLISGMYTLREQKKYKDIAVHPIIINEDHVHLILSRLTVSVEDVEVLNTAITTLQRSATYTELLQRYVSDEHMQNLPKQ